jgi:UDP-N-acetylmuramoyl-L-alanyl-D-glutamate--2,6-diaminopimelate ligase
MAAVVTALEIGLPLQDVTQGIAGVKGIMGRAESVPTNRDFTVIIDYAHTPDALENVLKCICSFKKKGQKLTLLFGCGGDRDKSKRSVMGSIASRYADFVIVTADNSRSEKTSDIINEITRGIDRDFPCAVIEDRKQAIEFAVENADENEIILLCGKGHEDYEINNQGKKHFSEKEIAANAVGKRFKRE